MLRYALISTVALALACTVTGNPSGSPVLYAPRSYEAGTPGFLKLTSPRRLCASTSERGDTITFPAEGMVRNNSGQAPAALLYAKVANAHASWSPTDPIYLEFKFDTLTLQTGVTGFVNGDVLSAQLERSQTAEGVYDACIPEGGAIMVRLTNQPPF